MTADVVSNVDVQFQNNFHSAIFDQNAFNADMDFSSVMEGEQEDLPLQVPPLQSVKGEIDDNAIKLFEHNNAIEGAGNIDDMLSVDMFDFGLNEQDAFAIAMFGGGGDSELCQIGVLNSPSKSLDDNIACNEENSGCPNTSVLVPVNSNLFEQLPPAKSDSDGFTDWDEQFVQPPALDQNGFSNCGDSGFPMPSQQNPFYNDIHFNWPQLNEMQCGSCQSFRQLIHSNGIQDTKLEIHGRNGQFYHAVMHTRCSMSGIPSSLEPQIVEFAMASTEYVKQFLFQYSLLRRREGFILRYDSLCPYPDPICGMNDGMDMYFNSGFYNQPMQQPFLNPFELASGLQASNNGFMSGHPLPGQFWMDRNYGPRGVDQTGITTPVKPPKSNVALQRERTGKLKISDLAAYFHLPINVAAKELAICPTVLKKICRRNGMRRWPHRKIKSIERIIMTLEQTIAEGNGEGVESIKAEIAMLKNERAQLCAGLVGDKK